MGTTHPTARADALRELSAAFNAGRITEAEYAAGWEAIDQVARPRAMRPTPGPALERGPSSAPAASPPAARPIGRRGPASRDQGIERRRRWAASGKLPPNLAAHFTQGEAAALAVVAGQHQRLGRCELAVGHIAALAGVSETTVRNAVREARRLGLVRVEERKVTAWRNDTNVVRVISAEWAVWLGKFSGGGCKRMHSTDTENLRKGFRGEKANAEAEARSEKPARPHERRAAGGRVLAARREAPASRA